MVIGQVKKFEYGGDYIEVDAPATGVSPTYSAGSCDNFVLEYHIKIEFINKKADDDIKKASHFGITKATVDLVYGSVAATDGQKVMIPRKTSLTYVESDKSRTNSGSVGYLKGMKLKVGTRIPK